MYYKCLLWGVVGAVAILCTCAANVYAAGVIPAMACDRGCVCWFSHVGIHGNSERTAVLVVVCLCINYEQRFLPPRVVNRIVVNLSVYNPLRQQFVKEQGGKARAKGEGERGPWIAIVR